MATPLELIINNIPVIISSILAFVGGYVLPRYIASPDEKTNQFKSINEAFRDLTNEYKEQAATWEAKHKKTEEDVIKLEKEIYKMKNRISLLDDYKRKYYLLLNWVNNVQALIAEQKDIPLLSSEIVKDLNKKYGKK